MRPSWTDLMLLGVGVAFTLDVRADDRLGAIILALLAARAAAARSSQSRSTRVRSSKRREVAVVGVGLATRVPRRPVDCAGADVSEPAEVPLRIQLVRSTALPAGTVVFNDYQLGGWMLWEHPTLDPVIDGRADVYDGQPLREASASRPTTWYPRAGSRTRSPRYRRSLAARAEARRAARDAEALTSARRGWSEALGAGPGVRDCCLAADSALDGARLADIKSEPHCEPGRARWPSRRAPRRARAGRRRRRGPAPRCSRAPAAPRRPGRP